MLAENMYDAITEIMEKEIEEHVEESIDNVVEDAVNCIIEDKLSELRDDLEKEIEEQDLRSELDDAISHIERLTDRIEKLEKTKVPWYTPIIDRIRCLSQRWQNRRVSC